MHGERGEQSKVREQSNDPRRRGDVKDPVVRRRVGRVHARDSEPFGLLVSRVRDGEVLEPDPEDRVVEEHLEPRLIEKDAVAKADPPSDVQQTAAERRRHEHDAERHRGQGGGETEAKEHGPRQTGTSQPQWRDDDRSRDDPQE